MKWVALSLPVPWLKGIPTRPETEQGKSGTSPTRFEEDREKLFSVLNRFRGDATDVLIPHPIFGCLTRGEWLRWGYLHADHHLRQFGR